ATPAGATPGYMRVGGDAVSTYDLLAYIRSAFDEDQVLDGVGLEAAGNANAWYAWRTHRKATGVAFEDEGAEQRGAAEGSRDPGSWDWDGVWETRVKGCIAGSLSEAVLYGGAGGVDDVVGGFLPLSPSSGVFSFPVLTGVQIRFQAMEESDIETVKGNIIRTIGSPMGARSDKVDTGSLQCSEG
ncbi:hypothetical protein IMZ48_16525, partial [Candidatus Bathyarchaeota archaeon]|nr:hypothetical protein [Candidatus Bathyarchaeota archaeon]